MSTPHLDDPTIREQALDWFQTLQQGGEKERAAFASWLKTSPRHVGEFLNVTTLYREFQEQLRAQPVDVEQLLNEAASNVVTLPRNSADGTEGAGFAHARGTAGFQPTRRLYRRRGWFVAAAALSGIAVAVLGWLVSGARTYETAAGEVRSFELIDGSVIHLNARSKVRVHYGKEARDIVLLEGEAMFKVARGIARPFRVYTENAVIQALGTQFDVYNGAQGTTVAVSEGAVRVSTTHINDATEAPNYIRRAGETALIPSLGRGAESANLHAGEKVKIDLQGAVTPPAPVDPSQVGAWRQRRLVFKANRLDEIAAEFNRYNQMQIRVEGDSVAERRLTGVFDADDPGSLLQFLKGDNDLAITIDGDELTIRQRNGAGTAAAWSERHP